MRVVIQRVGKLGARVAINGTETKGFGGLGLMILLGIEGGDTEEDVEWLVGKITKLRIFGDENQAMNLSVTDVGGNILIVSQFTLHASTRKGNRPSFLGAAMPEQAIPLYGLFIEKMRETLSPERVITGEFGADMQVEFVNDGPVTILMDSKIRE